MGHATARPSAAEATRKAWIQAQAASGTFSVSHTDLITGLPLPPPQYAYLCIPASLGAYDVVLNQICIEYPDLVFSEWRLLNGAIGAAACVRAGTA